MLKYFIASTFDHIKLIPLSVLLLLIGFSILIAGSFLAAFLWSVKDGQFEDDYTPSVRILFDDNDSPLVAPLNKQIKSDNTITNTFNSKSNYAGRKI